MSEVPQAEAAFLRAALQAAQAARDFLEWMEDAAERLAPARSRALAEETRRRFAEPLATARGALEAAQAPADLRPFAERLGEGWSHIAAAFELFTTFPEAFPEERIARILGSLHEVARAQEKFHSLRRVLPSFSDYWRLAGSASAAPAGHCEGESRILHVSAGGHHGGFSLFVPGSYVAGCEIPLIIALHGGSGNGRDFLWTWVREAESFGYLLISPTAVGETWSDVEDEGLLEILVWATSRFRVATNKVLLTGLSDGATFALLYGLAHPDVYRAIAPVCGVLHPANQALGNLERAKGVPIYLVHGALDFLFPVQLARFARDTLADAGARLEYRELPDLSHTYPRSENVRILRWFEGITASETSPREL
jgi:phospholipase/carboxylesterase